MLRGRNRRFSLADLHPEEALSLSIEQDIRWPEVAV